MYSNFQLLKKYISYYLNASNSKGHGIHSPFVFDFILNVLNNNAGYAPPVIPEEIRAALKGDKRLLDIVDYGAGSRSGAKKRKEVGQLARTALKSRKYAQLLFRIVKHYKPEYILELGTSLGVSTTYLALGSAYSKVITVEGSEAIAAIAKENFNKAGLAWIEIITGNFDKVLPALLPSFPRIDLAYIDGNHRYEPTIRYFEWINSKLTENSLLVFDDIHWSSDMEKAWEEIKNDQRVTCTIDLFFFGIVLFNRSFKEKQHFTIRF